MQTVRIGIIGTGGVANGAHITQLLEAQGGRITALCDIDPTALKKTGDRLHIPENRRFSDYKDLLACDEVDAVEICTPNYLHVPMAVDAIRAGKPFNLEKPLSTSYQAALPLICELEKNPVTNMMCFSYRFRPAVRYAKWILAQDLIGEIVSVNVAYLKSSAFIEGRRLDWRFVKEYAGTGVLGDLGVHLIDMTEFLVGRIRSVSATCRTVVKERKKLDSEEYAKVDTDDYCSFLAELERGIAGAFMITRCALGHKNTIQYDVYGTKGVISLDLNHPNVIGVCVGQVDLKSGSVHTVDVPSEFRITQEQTFIDLLQGKPCQDLPTVQDGVRCQKILDALVASDAEKRWITVEE